MQNDNDREDLAKLGAMMRDLIGNVCLALLLCLVLGLIARQFGAAGLGIPGLVVMFAVIHADPFGSWREKRSLRTVAAKTAVGVMIGAAILAITLSSDGFAPATAPTEEVAEAPPIPLPEAGEEATDGIGSNLPWQIFLIFPLVMLAPFFERLLGRRKPDAPDIVEDAQISAVFPIYMMATLALNSAVVGALYLLDVSIPVALCLTLLAILICVTETWRADPEDLLSDPDAAEWGPRPESAAEAWAGLRRALTQSYVSALFLGSVIYISLQAAMPYFGNTIDLDTAGVEALWPLMSGLLAASGVLLVVSTLLFIAGVAVLAGAALMLGRMKGADPLSIEELVKQASFRLFAGGMQHVRPDLEDD